MRRPVQKEELVVDGVFFIVSLAVSLLALLVFDVHWNFYPGGRLFPPEKFIFTDRSLYLWGGLLGGVVGFFLIKLLMFGMREEAAAKGRRRAG